MKQNEKIAVLLPSRGLIHSRTIEAVQANLTNAGKSFSGPHYVFYSHDKPIPEAQNYLVERAMGTDATIFWFVEEDNIFEEDVLFKMIVEQRPVIAIDYPVGPSSYSCIMKKDGEVYWCGFGCTLIRREVFDAMNKPWFTVDVSYRVKNFRTMEVEKQDVPSKYGGHDINFGFALREINIPIYHLQSASSGHLFVDQLGPRQYNDGTHQIREAREILHKQEYEGGE